MAPFYWNSVTFVRSIFCHFVGMAKAESVLHFISVILSGPAKAAKVTSVLTSQHPS